MDIKTQVKEGITEANESLLTRIKEFVNGDAALKASVEQLTKDLQARDAEIAALKAAHAIALAAKDAEIAALTSARTAAETKAAEDLKAAASKEAQTILAAAGVPPVDLKPENKNPANTKAEPKSFAEQLLAVAQSRAAARNSQ